MFRVNNESMLAIYYIYKANLFYLYGRYEASVESAEIATKYLDSILGMIFVPIHNFYYSLAMLADYARVDKKRRQEYIRLIIANQKKLKKWSQLGKENYLHKYYLVEAELMKLRQKHEPALGLYRKSREKARENGFLQEEALANELTANYCFSNGLDSQGEACLAEAYYLYNKWGAAPKVRQLEEAFPELLQKAPAQMTIPSRQTDIIENSTEISGHTLDLSSIVKASQAISGELDLKKLLYTLLNVIMENAGAQRAVLLLEKDGKLSIEAEGSTEKEVFTVLQSIPPESNDPGLPLSVINYTSRTHKNVVLNNAGDYGLFQTDPYISSQQPKSMLCTPVLSKGRLTGVLYLENNLTTAAFTPDKLQLLNIISTQAAISVKNALLFSKVENSKAQLKASLKEKETLLQEIHHRVKNNMQVIISLLRLQSRKIKDVKNTKILEESQDRIKSMALVHERLYQFGNLSKVDMSGYLKKLINGLFRSYGVNTDRIAVKFEIEDISFGLDIAIPFGLIVNELVSNSLKYAFPRGKEGEIKITLSAINNEKVVLVVRDNGIGIGEDIDFRHSESLGLELVTILVEDQLDGDIELNRTGGTTFRIRFRSKDKRG